MVEKTADSGTGVAMGANVYVLINPKTEPPTRVKDKKGNDITIYAYGTPKKITTRRPEGLRGGSLIPPYPSAKSSGVAVDLKNTNQVN